MIRKILIFSIVLYSIFQSHVISAYEYGVKRYSIFIGSNDGGKYNKPLRYAFDDAKKMAGVFKRFGGVPDENQILLQNPDGKQIINALSKIKKAVLQNSDKKERSEVIFYFSGHSDEYGILLGNSSISYENLKKAIASISSEIQVAIIDSCSSGAMTLLKGGKKIHSLVHDESVRLEGMAVITSSSEMESAQESEIIQGAIFTHYLVSGLLGAADVNRDKKITLEEAYQFAYQETLLRSGKTIYGLQHPAYHIQLKGFGNLVLTDISDYSSKLVLDKKIQGRISLNKNDGNRIAELFKKGSTELEIALEPGSYDIFLVSENTSGYGNFFINKDQKYYFRREQFKDFTNFEPTFTRGNNDPEIQNSNYNQQKTLLEYLDNKNDKVKTTSGAGPVVTYGISTNRIPDTMHISLRTASQFGSFIRFGGFGDILKSIYISDKNEAFIGAMAGLSARFLFRLDPLVISPSLDLGGGIIFRDDQTTMGFTSIYPHLDLELRIVNNLSLFIGAGYFQIFSDSQSAADALQEIPVSLGIYFGFDS